MQKSAFEDMFFCCRWPDSELILTPVGAWIVYQINYLSVKYCFSVSVFKIAIWFIQVLLFLLVTLFYLCFSSIFASMIQQDYAMENIRVAKRLTLIMSKYLPYRQLNGKYFKIKILCEGSQYSYSLENYCGILLEIMGGRLKMIKIKSN